MLNLTVMRICQNGIDIYVTVFNATTLLKNVKVDNWSEKNPNGYQRAVSDYRVKNAIKYLIDEDGTFPTSILLNVRGQVTFRPSTIIGDGGELGVLSLPPNSLPFWIIDGQHRLMAIALAAEKKNNFKDYSVPVCIFNLTKKYEEMRQFYIVNSRQKSVPTDLVQRHLYQSIWEKGQWKIAPFESEKRLLAAEAVPIVDILNLDKESPWYGKIQLPSEGKSSKHIVKQTSMADSIGYIFKSLSPIERDAVHKNPSDLARFLIQYWKVIRRFFPEAFADPDSYLIQKTTGIYVFHMVFPIILNECKAVDDFSPEKFKEILEKMLSELTQTESFVKSDFWHKKFGDPIVMGTGMKTFRLIASRLAAPFTFPEE